MREYFSHDYSARSDKKIKHLIQEHGLLGYGLFWAIVEDLYLNANALPTDYKRIAFEYRIDESIVHSVLNNFDLFVVKEKKFFSKSVQKRINEREHKSVVAREAANKRWNANAVRTHSEGNANKVKESKGNKSKEKKVFVAPTIDQVREYFNEYSKWSDSDNSHQSEKFFNRNESNGWVVGKVKMKNWKAAIRTWVGNNYDGCRAVIQVQEKILTEKDSW